MPEEWKSKLRSQFKINIKDLETRLQQQDDWFDQHADKLSEKDQEERVRTLDKLESIVECLEEALDILDDLPE